MKKLLVILLVVAFCAVLVCSCSAQDSVLDSIKEKGELVMLTNAAFPPYEYLGSGNEVAGVDRDICQAIADEIGVELKVVDMDFDGLLTALAAGKGDIVAAGLTVTDERKESVDFSNTYANATQYIIVQEGNADIASVDDLTGKTVGVQLGTTGDIYMEDIDAEVKQYKSGLEASMDLMNGKLDAVVLDKMPAENIVAANDGLTLVDSSAFGDEFYALAVAKGQEDLLEVINKVVDELYENGTVDEWTETHAAAAAEL